MDVVGAIYDRCRYHAIGRGFFAKITHCYINTQMDEISLYIVYVNYLGSLSSPIFFNLQCGNFKSIIQACNWHLLFCHFYYYYLILLLYCLLLLYLSILVGT